MPPLVRERLEASFGVDLDAVRVHQGEDAADLAFGAGARAFAYGHHIVLGEGARATDLALIGHEVAHVLQQQGVPVVQRCGGTCGCAACAGATAHEEEAARAARAADTGTPYTVTGRAPASHEQRVDEDEGWLASRLWGLLERLAPQLVPILRRGPEGVFEWIKERVSAAVESAINPLMAPVRAISGAGRWLNAHFTPLIAWVQDAAARIARNDCRPITEAAQKIEDVATRIITPIVEQVQQIAGRVGGFFRDVWARFGAPAWDFLRQYAGRRWEELQQLGDWIWNRTARIRALASRAWTWLKNRIGIGEGPEGQNGILQWIQGKARLAWEWLQARLAPYKRQITTVLAVIGGIAVMISPAGSVILAGAALVAVIQGVRWIRANLGRGDAIVRARAYAQTVLIPQLMGAVRRAAAVVNRMAATVSDKISEFSSGIGRLVGAAASTALQFLVDAAQWLADRALDVATWAATKLTAVAHGIVTGFGRLIVFLQPVLDFLAAVGRLWFDIYFLPLLLAGRLWNLIPSCIRDPFVDWIVPLILRQISIFQELVRDNEAWQRTRSDVMRIIRLVFVTKDFPAAIRATFFLILRMFNVPYELLVQVVRKAQVAWDLVVARPIEFLKNAVRTLGRGLQMYGRRLRENLLNGIEGWLFRELASTGITRPRSWTDPWALAEFVASVLGLSIDHIFDLMERRFERSTVDRLRRWYARLSRAWDWIMEMRGRSASEVTAAILESARGFARTIFEGMVTWIVGRVAVELSTMAAAAAATAGLSQLLDAARRIYRALQTAVRWMRQVLEMMNQALDSVMNIARGVLDPAASLLDSAMRRATPVVIGFLADQVGLGGIGEKIREIVTDLRARVDTAILRIIDRLRAIFAAVAQSVTPAAASGTVRVSERFVMRSVTHTLTTTATQSGVQVVMASNGRDLNAKIRALGAAINARSDADLPNKAEIRDLLEHIRLRVLEYNAMKNAWARRLRVEFTPTAPSPEFVREYTLEVISHIVALATAHGFTDLVLQTFVPDPLPRTRFIPEPIKSNIRQRLYERGSNWRNVREEVAATEQRAIDREISDRIVTPRDAGNTRAAEQGMADLKGRGKVLDTASLRDFRAKYSYVSEKFREYAVDHDPSLAEHWERHDGNKTSDAVRHAVVEGRQFSTLRLVTRRFNSQKAAYSLDGEANSFKRNAWVAPPFTSAIGKDIQGQADNEDLVTLDDHSLTYPDGTPYLPR